MDQVVVEGMVVVAAGRAYVASRPLVLARARRGNVDLPDVDAPDRSAPEVPAWTGEPEPGRDPWAVPLSVGLAALLGTVLARASMLI